MKNKKIFLLNNKSFWNCISENFNHDKNLYLFCKSLQVKIITKIQFKGFKQLGLNVSVKSVEKKLA